MEQYISKSALLAEIERLVNNYDKALDYEAALEDVRDFIDSLEVKEIQVKESAEIERDKEMCKENGDSLTQELGNVDRQAEEEEEIESDFVMGIIESEHRQPTFDDAIKYGMRLQKERLLAKIVDGEDSLTLDGVITFDYYDGDKAYGCVAHDSFCLEDWGLKDMDKVKILILKKVKSYD
jgi:hypothetical protein